MDKKDSIIYYVLVGILLTVIGAGLVWKTLRQGPEPAGELRSVTEFRDSDPLPPFKLSGPQGDFTNDRLMGQWSFVFFGYTQCPDVCPTALTLMLNIKKELAAMPGQRQPAVVFVSVDPQRDTRTLLDQYMVAFDPTFVGLRGSDQELMPLLKTLGVFCQRHDETDKKNYTVDHSAGIYLIDPAGRLAAVFSSPHEAKRMAADLVRIMKERE
jgi:protein SCO1/2